MYNHGMFLDSFVWMPCTEEAIKLEVIATGKAFALSMLSLVLSVIGKNKRSLRSAAI